jgi:hypothetical protein
LIGFLWGIADVEAKKSQQQKPMRREKAGERAHLL